MHRGTLAPHRSRMADNEPTSGKRGDDRGQRFVQLIQDLQSDRALSSDHPGIVVRRYIGPVRVRGVVDGEGFGFVEGGPDEPGIRAAGTNAVQLDRIHPLRNEDGGGEAHPLGNERYGSAMIPARARNDTTIAFVFVERLESSGRAPDLEGPGMLQALCLDQHITPDSHRKVGCVQERRHPDVARHRVPHHISARLHRRVILSRRRRGAAP